MILEHDGRAKMKASFTVEEISDLALLVVDLDYDDGPSVTNAAEYVVEYIGQHFDIAYRTIYYRDSQGQFDVLDHKEGSFAGFKPCTQSQRAFLQNLCLQ